MKMIGILAGLGPLAGAHVYQRLIELTPAENDEEHLPVTLIADPLIPSRVDHLLRQGPSPAPALIGIATRLQKAGADLVAVASVTTHAYHTQISTAIDVPVIDLRTEIAKAAESHALRRPAILCSTATATLRLLESAMYTRGIRPLYPDTRNQSRVQAVIDMIKRNGFIGSCCETLYDVLDGSWRADADGILLGCTELGLADIRATSLPVLSASDVLAIAAIREALTFGHAEGVS